MKQPSRAAPPVSAPPSRRTLRLEGPAPQRVAVVADTHSSPDPRALAALRALAPGLILHAGDIGDLAVLDALGAIAPCVAVRGNIDARHGDLPETLVLDLERGDGPTVRLLLLHIAVAGPRLRAEVRRVAVAERADLVVCGHSHVPFLGRDRDVAVFNPGSIGPRRFTLPIVFGVIELGRALSLEHVDVETGGRWVPTPARPPSPDRRPLG